MVPTYYGRGRDSDELGEVDKEFDSVDACSRVEVTKTQQLEYCKYRKNVNIMIRISQTVDSDESRGSQGGLFVGSAQL